jgi:hypothetical protein
MIRIAVALSMLWVIAGCVTTGAAPADVDAFRGQRSEPILAKLGPPESTERVAAGTVYRWRTFTRLENVPVQGTRTTYESGLPVTVPTTTFERQTQSCDLVLTVDGAGAVTDFSRNGSRQACAPLLDRL